MYNWKESLLCRDKALSSSGRLGLVVGGGIRLETEKRLAKLGYRLPEVAQPVAAYVPGVQTGNLIFTSGQLPVVKGRLVHAGKVGGNVTLEQGYEAARLCALNALAVVKALAGDLDRVARIVKVTGYVNSAPGFTDQPRVINGASEFLGEVFGEKGRHARAALGCNELPLEAAVELDLVVELKPGGVQP